MLDLRLDELVTFELVVEDDLGLLELLTDFDVDVEVVLEDEGLTELEVDVFDEVEMCTDDELELATVEPSMYISSRFPAPQYSYGLPGQIKEQSPKAARTDPVLMALPQ